MRSLSQAIFFGLAISLTLPIAVADTTILERDRSDRQDQADKYVPDPSVSKPNNDATPGKVQAFTPFTLARVEIEGSTLPRDALERVTSKFVGKTIDMESAKTLAKGISALYARSDIALYNVLIGNQNGADGALRIVVIEGHVGGIATRGDVPERVANYAKKILAPVSGRKPLRKSEYERPISLLTATPGVRVEKIEMLGMTERGAVTLVPTLSHRTVEAGIGVSTRGSSSLGDTMMQADVSFNSLVRAGDRTTLSFGTPVNFENFRYYGVAHQTPLGYNGLRLAMNGAYLVTEPENTGTRGTAVMAGMQLSYPIILRRKRALTIGLGFDGLDSDNAFLGQSISGDNTRVARLSASFVDVQSDARLNANLSISRGFDVLGAQTATPTLSDTQFFKINGQIGYALAVIPDFSLRLLAGGQYSDDHTPGSEQSSLGGQVFGRAFESSVVSGDSSVGVSAELAYAVAVPAPFSGVEVYAFVDGGQIWRVGRPGFPSSETGLASAGFGTRLSVFENFSFGLELGHPIDFPDGVPHDEGWRTVFTVTSRTN